MCKNHISNEVAPIQDLLLSKLVHFLRYTTYFDFILMILKNGFVHRLINAQKRFDLSYIVITFDASNEVGYKGPGFHYPEIKKETPRGRLNLFPCAFACPDAPKADFWATIIMTIDDNDQNLNKLNKIIHTYDNRVSKN